jgi:hypothetical protein
LREFVTRVRDSVGEVDETQAISFLHDKKKVTFYKPSPGQAAIMMTMGQPQVNDDDKVDLDQASNFIQLFLGIMEKETRRYFSARLLDANDSFSDLDPDDPGGLWAIWRGLMEEWSARPTKQPSDYRPSRRSTGKSSTASSRAKASTSSRSR